MPPIICLGLAWLCFQPYGLGFFRAVRMRFGERWWVSLPLNPSYALQFRAHPSNLKDHSRDGVWRDWQALGNVWYSDGIGELGGITKQRGV